MSTDANTFSGTGVATIDNDGEWPCEFVIAERIDYVQSSGAVKPDTDWTFTDDAGHFHAFAERPGGEELPTLNEERVPVPCDGSCGDTCNGEGYTITRWTCRICGQQIEPAYIPDARARTMGVPIPLGTTAEVTVISTQPLATLGSRDREVSIRIRHSEGELFGTGFIRPVRMSGGGQGGVRVESLMTCRFLNERLTD
ncbi:hypothetical protein JOL79_11420 [Microbispora sp. RL4-1S]|uniref:Uncharacterized protein n=1 Tax=Microbispora oryzae TaxID=2806554 RepID=A0A940WGM1_9ACTN|nr:hypothetical protein [Microbispora oryzae]MBP2704423.1 hypothetical protein [Microbispora oryzae]